MNDNSLPAVQSITEIAPVSIQNMKNQVIAIQQAMKDIMVKDVHFGVIPGTDKPTLLKPGAEKIGLLFRLAPTFKEEVIERGNGHREVRVVCTLTHPTGVVVAQGLGVCSTLESKYRWRKGQRLCPNCGSEAIIKGKAEYGGGWLCFAKKGGCGAKFPDGDKAIEEQQTDRVENPDIADTYNTVMKMALKRAHVGAIISGTAASDLFNQDMEDLGANADAAKGESDHSKKAEAGNNRPAQQPQQSNGGPINWESFKYRYHLPHKKEGKDMDAVRAWLKKQGFKFNAEDKHWYGNLMVDKIAEYIRPREGDAPAQEPEVLPADDNRQAALSPDDDRPAWDISDMDDDDMPNF